MSYNHEAFPKYVRTAGKITVVTAITGLLVFMVAFMFDVGTQELNRVSAQQATTTLTVLNTPPVFSVNPYEVIESSTSSPTNSGDVIQWSAIASDPNLADYYLLLCSTDSASPTPNPGAAPDCGAGVQWGVSTATISGTTATVSTTTSEVGQFAELNVWYAWACDADLSDPKCTVFGEQGDYATSSSPFNMNYRPQFVNAYNDGPADPNATMNFLSTSTDPDVVGGSDNIFILTCATNLNYSSSTNSCTDELASSTVGVDQHASTTYTIPYPAQDQTYDAYSYIFDEHGHTATASPIYNAFTVNNVAPTVLSGEIVIYGDAGPGSDLSVSIPAGETPSSTLEFTLYDGNSCVNAASTTEITNFLVSVFRSGVGSTTCNGDGANFDENNCYESSVPTTTWNLSCTATTTCAGPSQDDIDYQCTFPLWFLADPTDGGTPWATENWSATVRGVDDNFATGTLATSSNPKELTSFSSIDVIANEIAYGSIAPGDNTGTLSATSTLLNIGNTGLDQNTQGESMCGTYTVATECPVSGTSTIPEFEQQFASTSLAYDPVGPLGPGHFELASSSYQELELDVNKTTSTSSPQQGVTWWGIEVPASITLSGSYTGMNTFVGVVAEVGDW